MGHLNRDASSRVNRRDVAESAARTFEAHRGLRRCTIAFRPVECQRGHPDSHRASPAGRVHGNRRPPSTQIWGILGFGIGPVNVYLSDLLLALAVVLVIREATLRPGQPIPPANRPVIALVLAYCAYQVAVVLPVAVLFYGLDPIAVVRQLTIRVALVLIPFVYLVGLKYVSPQRVVSWVNVAAVVSSLLRALQVRDRGNYRGAAGRRLPTTRALGRSRLLFGFLILTSLFLRRPALLAYLLALLGLLGRALDQSSLRLCRPSLHGAAPARRTHIGSASVPRSSLLVGSSVSAVRRVFDRPRQCRRISLHTMLNPTADKTASDRVDRSEARMGVLRRESVG